MSKVDRVTSSKKQKMPVNRRDFNIACIFDLAYPAFLEKKIRVFVSYLSEEAIT